MRYVICYFSLYPLFSRVVDLLWVYIYVEGSQLKIGIGKYLRIGKYLPKDTCKNFNEFLYTLLF